MSLVEFIINQSDRSRKDIVEDILLIMSMKYSNPDVDGFKAFDYIRDHFFQDVDFWEASDDAFLQVDWCHLTINDDNIPLWLGECPYDVLGIQEESYQLIHEIL